MIRFSSEFLKIDKDYLREHIAWLQLIQQIADLDVYSDLLLELEFMMDDLHEKGLKEISLFYDDAKKFNIILIELIKYDIDKDNPKKDNFTSLKALSKERLLVLVNLLNDVQREDLHDTGFYDFIFCSNQGKEFNYL